MRILITGASGFIGRNLLQSLSEAGHEVVACVRNPAHFQRSSANIKVIQADFATDHAVADWMPRLQSIDVVINAVGIIQESGSQTFDALHTQAPIALFQACEFAKVKRVIQISALGADETAFSQYHLSKRQADDDLKKRTLDWVVILPSIVYGPGAKSMALFKAMAALPLIPLIGSGEQQIQPIHINDMTRAIVQLVNSPSQLQTEVVMVGPTAITMKDLYRKLRHWLELGKARFVSIPYWLALYGSSLGRLFGPTAITPESIQMLCKGNTAEVAPFVTQFGFKPQSLEQVFAATPAQQADQWHAGLYLLAPLLRLTIAFVWLFTGIVSAFIFPLEQSYAMLARVGIEGIWQPIMLYGAASLDLLLGMATLFAFRLKQVALIQIGVILLYSMMITFWLPEHWLHPFGAMSKNLPLLVAILIMMVVEKR